MGGGRRRQVLRRGEGGDAVPTADHPLGNILIGGGSGGRPMGCMMGASHDCNTLDPLINREPISQKGWAVGRAGSEEYYPGPLPGLGDLLFQHACTCSLGLLPWK